MAPENQGTPVQPKRCRSETMNLDNPSTPDIARSNLEIADEQMPPDNTPKPSQTAKCSLKLGSMTPNTRKRKSRMAEELTEDIINLNLTPEEEVAILKLTIRQRGLEDMFRSEFVRKPTNAGRKMTSFETRLKVWDFWHDKEYITESTITTRLARLRITERQRFNMDFHCPC